MPLADAGHRPWPLPRRPWVVRMAWCELAFLHWPVEPERLAGQLPPGLELDLFEGQAWLGVVPFFMREVAPPLWPLRRAQPDFAELNLRTYVRVGDRPGVWFFSLDAASKAAVRGARSLLHLPYMDADFETRQEGEDWVYGAERTHKGEAPGSFQARFGPAGPVQRSQPGSLEAFLTERYCLYAHDGRRLRRGEVHHEPWPLQLGRAEVERCTLAEPLGIELAGPPPLVHFAKRVDVVAWWPEKLKLNGNGSMP